MLRRVTSITAMGLALGLITSAGVQAQSPANNKEPEFGNSKVVSLLILADNDPLVAPTVDFDAALIRFLLQEQIPRQNLAEPVVLLQSREEASASAIDRAIEALRVTSSDTLFCFYSGPGGVEAEGVSSLRLPDGSSLAAKSLMASLRGKSPRLTVLVLDFLSPGASIPLGDEQLPLRVGDGAPRALAHLMFHRRGTALMQPGFLAEGNRGFYLQEPTARGEESLGSVFVRELVKECTIGESAQEASADWSVVAQRVEAASTVSCKLAAELALDRGNEAREPDEAIRAYSAVIRVRQGDVEAYHHRAHAWLDKDQYARAIEDLNAAIGLEPKDSALLACRAKAWNDQNQYDKAMEDCNEAIRIEPANDMAYHHRAHAWVGKHEHDRAIEDFNAAIRLEPKNPSHLRCRADELCKLRQYEKAIRDYNEALRLGPGYPQALKGLAWLLATCPDSQFRDGNQAVQYATRACQAELKDGFYLDTLAAAYAESGQFDRAVEYQQKAIDLATKDKDKEDYRKRLKLYQDRQPYRDIPVPKRDK